ncbi:hypothetical protein EVAR_69341_1 [Eumeta japonica]|uniref:Uncharacterized protein n=1 Tax=Eumeta variegata TaxID=151549 RepID=A0A4C2A0K4_EUMVA|nr:hypothetical protein EVAR_69341_1 [Eumeta japonica]
MPTEENIPFWGSCPFIIIELHCLIQNKWGHTLTGLTSRVRQRCVASSCLFNPFMNCCQHDLILVSRQVRLAIHIEVLIPTPSAHNGAPRNTQPAAARARARAPNERRPRSGSLCAAPCRALGGNATYCRNLVIGLACSLGTRPIDSLIIDAAAATGADAKSSGRKVDLIRQKLFDAVLMRFVRTNGEAF